MKSTIKMGGVTIAIYACLTQKLMSFINTLTHSNVRKILVLSLVGKASLIYTHYKLSRILILFLCTKANLF